MSKIFMSEKNIRSLLKASIPVPRDHALFRVALATGFRAGDLINIKRDEVAPYGVCLSSVRITMQKTGRTIERHLPDSCRVAIKNYLHTRTDDSPFLFRSESNNSKDRNGPMNRSSLHRIFKRYLGMMYSDEALRGNACHTTRRSMAKIISDRAGRIEPASKFLGHSSVANTILYLDMDYFGKQADDIVSTVI